MRKEKKPLLIDRNKIPQYLFAFLILSLITSCHSGMQARRTSSVVAYLYPNKTDVAEKPAVPTLSLPLSVGIAFVPSDPTTARGTVSTLNEKQRMDLIDRVAASFRGYPFVKSIQAIPSQYLMPHGGFTNLEQIRTMYGVDVIALLSFDQIQHTDQGLLSLTYWTIVGAYVVKGEKNDTSTMLDAAVYDIPSRKMLFRAPGGSQIKGAATPVNLSEQLRKDSYEGFEKALDQLIVNLKEQLDLFKEKAKSSPEEYMVVTKPEYRGSGMLDVASTLILVVAGGIGVWTSRRRKK